uniref:VQ domain-containing protein n=2 Tax=Brassica oleracea var. oleracea TaxID=109376 RepID=A0A0D3AUP5_BRAOL
NKIKLSFVLSLKHLLVLFFSSSSSFFQVLITLVNIRKRMDDQRNSDNHHHHLGVNKIGKNIRKDPSNQQNQQQNPQALFYNINKTDFRSIVQQLTGLGSASSVNPPQSTNPPKPPNSRLVKVRPAPLTQVNHHPPPPPVQSDPIAAETVERNNQLSVNPAESPISAYMRYLIESSPVGNRPQLQNQNPAQPSPGLFPSHQPGPSPMLFQSPASQFVLSPPPRSPFPILSPNFFTFSPRFIAGGNESLPPPSPGFFFPLLSPLWKNQ